MCFAEEIRSLMHITPPTQHHAEISHWKCRHCFPFLTFLDSMIFILVPSNVAVILCSAYNLCRIACISVSLSRNETEAIYSLRSCIRHRNVANNCGGLEYHDELKALLKSRTTTKQCRSCFLAHFMSSTAFSTILMVTFPFQRRNWRTPVYSQASR